MAPILARDPPFRYNTHALPCAAAQDYMFMIVRTPQAEVRVNAVRIFPVDSTALVIHSIGHSTRSEAEFISLLEASRIEVVADVRRMPGSRRLPQFDSDTLARSLAASDIGYCWIPQLGGRRRPQGDSANNGWRHAAFRAYADHMATEEFADGILELLMLANGAPTVMMCAEVLWWRCHRRLIADALVVLGVEVVHIVNEGKQEFHRLAPPARVVNGELTYRNASAP
jgi:Uncharacterized conserved protein